MSATLYNGTIGAQSRRAGLASLTIDGEAVDVAGDLTYDATSVTREPLLGQSGPQGYSEMPKYGSMSASIRDAGSLSVANFMAMTDVAVVAVLANGKTVYGSDMTCYEVSEVRTAEASFTVTFRGAVTESST